MFRHWIQRGEISTSLSTSLPREAVDGAEDTPQPPFHRPDSLIVLSVCIMTRGCRLPAEAFMGKTGKNPIIPLQLSQKSRKPVSPDVMTDTLWEARWFLILF